MTTMQELLRLEGQTAIITGAANGIGKATAVRFAELGCHLILIDLDEDGLHGLRDKLSSPDIRISTYVMDLQEKAAIDLLWESIDGSQVDILINNAGIYPFKDFMKLDEAYLDKVMRINLYSVLWMCQHMIRSRKKKGGRIVNIGSIEAIMPFKKELIQYSMSKVGVITLTRDLAREFGRNGFRVNALLPGGVMTEGARGKAREVLTRLDFGLVSDAYNFMQRIPLGRLGDPDEIARMMVVLSTGLSSYVNGALIPVDGGFLSA